MKKFREKQFTARYNQIMYFTFCVVLLISAALVTIQVRNQTKHDNTQLSEEFKNRSIAIDNLIVSITEHLNLMQTQAQTFFLDAEGEHSHLFDALSNTDDQFYSLDNIPFPYAENNVGNLTGKGVISEVSGELSQELEMALSLNSLFSATQQNLPNAAWIYYTSKNNFINIYPWTSSGDFRFSEELYTHDFYQSGLPAVNPERNIFWTTAYIDEYGKGMMVTAAKPIYHGEEFLGTVAIDITLDRLTEYVQNFQNRSGTLMILNQSGQLIAHPTLTSSSDTEVKLFNHVIPEALQPHVDDVFKTAMLQPNRREGYLYIWYEMENAPWKIIYISREPHILVKIFSMVGSIFLLLLAGLAYMLVGMRMITFREFIYPAESLVRHIFMESENKSSPIRRIPKQWLPWFEEVSRAFAQNRNLVKEIKEKNRQLTDMNISLERYMPKFILIVNLGNGCGSTLVGNFFADALSKKAPSKKTVYMEFPNPENIGNDLLLDEVQNIYKHPNGYDIWMSYDLGLIPEDAMTSLLMTKVLHNYNNIVINATVQEPVDDFISQYLEPMLHYAKAVILMLPPDRGDDKKIESLAKRIKQHIRQDQTNVYMLLNKPKNIEEPTRKYDFEIPLLKDGCKITKDPFVIPDQALSVVSTLVERVERVHQISVFIPTTISIDHPIDTRDYVKRTMMYFGDKFGGATSSQAQGVWNSDTSGMVSEIVYIIVSYTTEEDLSLYMDDVIEFIKEIKQELSQEAMAMEINKKLVLI